MIEEWLSGNTRYEIGENIESAPELSAIFLVISKRGIECSEFDSIRDLAISSKKEWL